MGEMRDRLLGSVGQSDHLQDIGDAFLAFFPFHAVDPCKKRQIVLRAQGGI